MPRTLSHESAFWRRLAYVGARYGPDLWLRYSPPVFGAAFAVALPDKRRRVRETLEWVRGPAGRVRTTLDVLDTFVTYAQCLAEALAAERPEARDGRVHERGAEHLRAALAAGRGVIVVTAHVGPWDAAARLLRQVSSREVVIAMAKEPDERARSLHDGVRERGGVRVVHVGAHPMDALPLLRHLQDGGIVAAQLDRGAPSGRVLHVPLFGREFAVPEGPFRLAKLSGAPVLPLFARRVGHFEYEVVVKPPLVVDRDATAEQVFLVARSAVEAMAAFVRESPTQWFQF